MYTKSSVFSINCRHCVLESSVFSVEFRHCVLESSVFSVECRHCVLGSSVFSVEFRHCALKSWTQGTDDDLAQQNHHQLNNKHSTRSATRTIVSLYDTVLCVISQWIHIPNVCTATRLKQLIVQPYFLLTTYWHHFFQLTSGIYFPYNDVHSWKYFNTDTTINLTGCSMNDFCLYYFSPSLSE